MDSKDQVVRAPVSNVSGYSFYYTNIGLIQNKGVELLVNYKPVQTSAFSRDMSLNFTKMSGRVIEMPDELEEISYYDNGSRGVLKIREGSKLGELRGLDYLRAPDGQKLIQANGFPLTRLVTTPYGNALPDWTAGLTNTFNYKGLGLSFLLEWRYAQQLGHAIGANGTDTYAQTDNTLGWTNLYLYVVPQLNAIIKKAEAENSPVYLGIAKTLLAYNLGIATASWENVPYSQADQGNFSPAYDLQEQTYANIQKLLDEAIIALGNTTGAKPGADDLIFNGDAAKWMKTAYTLKARYALHLSTKSPIAAAQSALASLANAMKSNDDDFQLKCNSKNLNPWYSRVAIPNTTSNLSITFTKTYVDLMNGTTQKIVDPRLPKVIALKGSQTVYAGVIPGSGSGSTVDLTAKAWHSNIESPLVFATYSE